MWRSRKNLPLRNRRRTESLPRSIRERGNKYFRSFLFAEFFITDGQLVSTFCTAPLQYLASVRIFHAGFETVYVTATAPARLICSFCHLGGKLIVLTVKFNKDPKNTSFSSNIEQRNAGDFCCLFVGKRSQL